ncbi:addiction module toxin, HicA family [Paenibacillus selenitireducens]|uniref:Addiction module toxin, HicA family n=1 Tax=Paenibacillus selenitireducens TaxID=1324314 RepID=A0A1T2X9Z4_9BACL|nr:type II toxin-antitoxin system HicA family toxin [Paenibacillus selenitireducens]OPA76724.1 addiction module toxin, HicA family [Paenibacillus selenitireducens]
MKSYSSRELIQMALQKGWYFISQEGSHHHYKHPTHKHKLTITHPRKDLKPKTLRNILKDMGD